MAAINGDVRLRLLLRGPGNPDGGGSNDGDGGHPDGSNDGPTGR